MYTNPFTKEESLAIVRLIWILIFSDNTITRNESDYFQQTLDNLEISEEDFNDYVKSPDEDSYEVVRNMSSKKKTEFGKILRCACDGDNINKAKLSKLNDILVKVDLFGSDRSFRKRDDDTL